MEKIYFLPIFRLNKKNVWHIEGCPCDFSYGKERDAIENIKTEIKFDGSWFGTYHLICQHCLRKLKKFQINFPEYFKNLFIC